MNKASFLRLLTLLLLLPIAAHADQSNLATPFATQGDADAKNQQKAKNYIRSEYIHAMTLARVAVLYDECVSGGEIAAVPISAETQFKEFVDKEKSKPSKARPDMVADEEIAAAMNQAYSDAKIKLQSRPHFADQQHCLQSEKMWPQFARRFKIE